MFQDNKADNGGAIRVEGLVEIFQIENSLFTNNSASEFGGAIYFSNKSKDLIIPSISYIRCEFNSIDLKF